MVPGDGNPAGLDDARLAGLDALGDVVVVIDADGAVRWANRAAEAFIGEPLAAWVGRSGLGLVHPDDVELSLHSLETVQGKAVGTPIEIRLRTPGGWRLVELIGSHLDEHHIALVMRDLTARRRWEVAGDDVARFRSIVQNSAALTALVDQDGMVLSVSAAVTRQLGHDPEVVCNRPFVDLVDVDDRAAFQAALQQTIAGTRPGVAQRTVEINMCSRGGWTVPFELTITSLLDDPTVEGLVVTGHDITRLRAAQEALAALASHDGLTGLLNRRSFGEALEREWLLAGRDGVDSYIAVLDLNAFKQVNDRFGHAVGDEALIEMAQALRAVVRSTDVIGRLGGDEFGVLLVRCGSEDAAQGFRDRIEEELTRRPWPHDLVLTAAIGYSSLKSSASPSDALHQADLEMLRTKATTGSR